MTGHNHYSDCSCGWCLNQAGRGRRRHEPLYASPDRPASFTTYECFTVPNASCPICGASVFFYQSAHGGRVFFDELGPPWPKHPCTDNVSKPVELLSRSLVNTKRVIEWEREGWEPIIIRASRLDANWHAIPVQNLKNYLFFDALADAPLHLAGTSFGLMLPWDNHGWSLISYLSVEPEIVIHEVPVFERRRFQRSSRSEAVSARANRNNPAGYF